MLINLSIQNIVLIRQCDIAFDSGLCVLTGETGAGKSILLDALGLVLGTRSDARLVRLDEKQASVSAEFDITNNRAAHIALEELGLEDADSIIIRRTLAVDGKTQCFINDQKVTVAALKSLGDTLVEIHGQHDQRGLLDPSSHGALLDAYGNLRAQRDKVASLFDAWKTAVRSLDILREMMMKMQAEEEYLRYMAGELSQLRPEIGEEETLSDKRTRMMSSERIMETLNNAMNELQGTNPVEGTLRSAQRVLSRSTVNMGDQFAPAIDALERALVEVQEAGSLLDRLGRDCEYNQNELESIEERLFALKAAARKYNLSVDELPGLLEEVETKLSGLTRQHTQESALTKAVETTRAAFVAEAEKLSEARRNAAVKLEKAVAGELAPLKMGGTHFKVRIDLLPDTSWSPRGMDAIAFEAATNVVQIKNAHFAPLAKIASGGELSRFMLALKVILSSVKSTPTLIFDEIDTGTGGAVADAIGQRLAILGGEAQVLVVTHLPQVAARGVAHLRISKAHTKQGVETSVEPLSGKHRQEELARMLAGAEVTNEARKAAGKLLEAAG